MKSYTTRDVAKLLGLSEAQVRSQARVGYLAPDRGPRNSYRFSFQDLVLLRTAKALSEARIAPRRIRRALRTLISQLPAGRSLSGLRISSEGHRIVVRDGDAGLEPGVGPAPARLPRRGAGGPGRADRAPPGAAGAPIGPSRSRRSSGTLSESTWRARPRRTPATRTPARWRSTRGTRRPGSTSAGGSRRTATRSWRSPSIAPHWRPSRGIPPRRSTWARRCEELGRRAEAIQAYRQGARGRRSSSPTRISIWRGCTSRPASGRRRCGTCRPTSC